MLKCSHKIVGALLLSVFLFAGEARSQSFDAGGDMLGYGQQPPLGSNPFEDDEAEPPTDTTRRERRPRRPLESYFFNDSLRAQANFTWNPDLFFNRVHMSRIDTVLNRFNIDHPFLKEDVGDAFQGHMGGASIPLNYHRRPDSRDFSFTNPYYSNIYTPENAPFYNVKNPFTRLEYIKEGQKSRLEDNFALIHAQNITPSTGFNITYRTVGTKGIYMNQRTHNTKFSSGISHTGKKYSMHAGYIFNKLDMRDNGGVVNDYFITDSLFESRESVPVWLSARANNTEGARNLLRNNTFYTVHSYGIPLRSLTDDDFSISDIPTIFVGYAFRFDTWSRRYTDIRELTDPRRSWGTGQFIPDHEYYNDWFINSDRTLDSLAERNISNRVFVQLQPWDRDAVIGTIDAGIGVDIHQYYQFSLDDYITGNSSAINRRSYYIYGAVDGRFRQYFDWNGRVHLVPAGYRQGDIEAEASALMSAFLRGKPISLSGRLSYSLKEPSYWVETFYSNHFKWSNSFEKENETRLEVTLNVPQINAEAVFSQSVTGNKIYFGSDEEVGRSPDVKPMQTSDVISVTGLFLRKDFGLGRFHFNNRVLLQWSTNQQVAPVPLASLHMSYFFETDIVKNILKMQFGLDGRYNTKYYVFGFNPAVGQFYVQDRQEITGFPMIDLFATFKWKRMRIILKLEHANQNLFSTTRFFNVLHYPLNDRVFKFGLSWTFYD